MNATASKTAKTGAVLPILFYLLVSANAGAQTAFKLPALPEGAKAITYEVFGNSLVLGYSLERQGLISSVEDWYVYVDGVTFGPEESAFWPQISNDGKACAVRIKTGDGYSLASGKERMGPFDSIAQYGFTNGSKPILWYVAQIGEAMYLHFGKDSFGPYGETGDFIGITPDNLPVYSARTGSEWYLYAGKAAYGPFEKQAGYDQYSPNGKYFSYFAKSGGEWAVYVGKDEALGPIDNKEDYPRPSDLSIHFAPDGKNLAIAQSREGSSGNHGWYLMFGGEEIGPVENLYPLDAYLDASQPAFVALNGNKGALYSGTRKITDIDGWYDVKQSPDNALVAYKDRVGEGEYYLRAGKEAAGPFYNLLSFNFSPKGSSLAFAYVKEKGGKAYLQSGKDRFGPFDDVGQYAFSDDGKTLAYFAKRDGAWRLYAGKEEAGPFDAPGFVSVSPDDKLVAYSFTDAQDFKKYVRVGQAKHSYYSDYGMTAFGFSPDGKSFAVSVDTEDGMRIVYSGKDRYGPFKNAYGAKYLPDGSLMYFVDADDGTYLYVGAKRYCLVDTRFWR